MDRMKEEVKEKNLKHSQEKEKVEKTEQCRRTESVATRTMTRMKDVMKEKDQELAEEKEKTKDVQKRFQKIMNLAALALENMKEKMK